jgi:histidine ammonia-lyase
MPKVSTENLLLWFILVLASVNAFSIWNNQRVIIGISKERGATLQIIREEIAASASDRWSGKDMRRLADEFGKLNPEAKMPEVRHEP